MFAGAPDRPVPGDRDRPRCAVFGDTGVRAARRGPAGGQRRGRRTLSRAGVAGSDARVRATAARLLHHPRPAPPRPRRTAPCSRARTVAPAGAGPAGRPAPVRARGPEPGSHGGAPVRIGEPPREDRGAVVFASWCEPCADQAPRSGRSPGSTRPMATWRCRHRDSDPAAEARASWRATGLPSPSCRTLGDAFDVVGLPETVVLDREGRVIWRYGGRSPTRPPSGAR